MTLGGSVRCGECGMGIIHSSRFITGAERQCTDVEGREPSCGMAAH